MQKSVFETLNAINVNDKVEKKKDLTYLSWSYAWGEVKKVYSDATYNIVFDPNTNKPYFYDETLGYMVMTSVTIQEQTLEMWLPVMDGANQAMKHESYEYSTRYGVKTVDAATMFDINKTLMRCLTKNLAMFGLGLYIFAGEDLPEVDAAPKNATPVKKAPAKKVEPSAELAWLKVGDDNWTKVAAYVEVNKANGYDTIVTQLKRKYQLSNKELNEIKKIIG
jgi:SpoVK/Ycf46/Vps4 family AAA+-type ATPase